MHDLTYANRILDGLKREMGRRDKSTPANIDAYLSPLGHVTPQRLKEVFDMVSKEEGFTNVALNVHVAEFSARCRQCGHRWKSSLPTFECPKCGLADFGLEKYEEFYIGSIRVE
jgi:Zn finger protein HypA/HybF involved in hydrogenase expression